MTVIGPGRVASGQPVRPPDRQSRERCKRADATTDAPVAALAGVTATDAELLRQAFQIKTSADLGRNKFFRAAPALVTLADGGAS